MRLIDPRDFTGTQKIRILSNIVAGGRPRRVGEIIELPSHECYELICARNAEPFIPAPAFESLE